MFGCSVSVFHNIFQDRPPNQPCTRSRSQVVKHQNHAVCDSSRWAALFNLVEEYAFPFCMHCCRINGWRIPKFSCCKATDIGDVVESGDDEGCRGGRSALVCSADGRCNTPEPCKPHTRSSTSCIRVAYCKFQANEPLAAQICRKRPTPHPTAEPCSYSADLIHDSHRTPPTRIPLEGKNCNGGNRALVVLQETETPCNVHMPTVAS